MDIRQFEIDDIVVVQRLSEASNWCFVYRYGSFEAIDLFLLYLNMEQKLIWKQSHMVFILFQTCDLSVTYPVALPNELRSCPRYQKRLFVQVYDI